MTHDELRIAVRDAIWGADNVEHAADAAIAAVREALRDPSDVMSDVGFARLRGQPVVWSDAGYCWRAMLAASPLTDPRA